MVPFQQSILVTSETPDTIASYWGYMTETFPDSFNAWFAMVPCMHVTDD